MTETKKTAEPDAPQDPNADIIKGYASEEEAYDTLQEDEDKDADADTDTDEDTGSA